MVTDEVSPDMSGVSFPVPLVHISGSDIEGTEPAKCLRQINIHLHQGSEIDGQRECCYGSIINSNSDPVIEELQLHNCNRYHTLFLSLFDYCVLLREIKILNNLPMTMKVKTSYMYLVWRTSDNLLLLARYTMIKYPEVVECINWREKAVYSLV